LTIPHRESGIFLLQGRFGDVPRRSTGRTMAGKRKQGGASGWPQHLRPVRMLSEHKMKQQ
jgi:hypothetical protein